MLFEFAGKSGMIRNGSDEPLWVFILLATSAPIFYFSVLANRVWIRLGALAYVSPKFQISRPNQPNGMDLVKVSYAMTY